jgi:transcriptional regulator with XRE-family HTH domain
MCIFTFSMKRTPRRRRHYPDLATYIEKTGDTQLAIAIAVGTTQAYISRIAAGQSVPQPELAKKLAAYARIPLDSFIKVRLAARAAAGRVA